MLIAQIIEFHLRRPGPPCRTCTPITVKFMTKQKSLSKENLRVDYYSELKYCRRQCALLYLRGPGAT